MCMDMILQEILKSAMLVHTFETGQQKQGINVLPLSKMRNLNEEILLERKLEKKSFLWILQHNF